jgi:hypothetical protein
MTDSVFEFSEKVERPVNAKGIQVTDEMGVALLTDAGKKASLERSEIADELADLKSVYNRLMVKLIKKADPDSTITVDSATTELNAKLTALDAPAE